VWAIAQIPESQAAAVTAGAKVAVRATAWPAEEFIGHVVAILPDVDAATRTLPVRLEIENPKSHLVPGMFVSMEFEMAANMPQLLVPSEAVIATGSRSVVVVAREAGGFDVVNVKTGSESAGRTEILAGLTEGQSVVISGQFLIDSEASLKSSVSRLTTPADAPSMVSP
jgi:Cu(I)/Ag(I) efflux system membrane fusion protein